MPDDNIGWVTMLKASLQPQDSAPVDEIGDEVGIVNR
ncbi:hypothetical protein C8D88_12369 [Lentzea atacamensis]|uniref:Uncharacterized protein n=1 Tax=Lentzea atacamensis TaxID=531938 RepID=A0A316HQZ1_9PSEU|nr:hypothetical protein C8D88_12369 [Lentzea atacamensis]